MISIGKVRPSLNEFKMYFNDRARNIRPQLMIHHIEINYKNRFPMFFIPLSKTDVIFGSLRPDDGTIHHVAIVRKNDRNVKSKLELIITIALLLDTLKPNLNQKDKQRILERLHLFDEQVDIYNARIFASFEEFDLMLLSAFEAGFYSLTLMYR